jgi:hypothetical protein
MHQQSLLVSAFLENEMVCFHLVGCTDASDSEFEYRMSTSMWAQHGHIYFSLMVSRLHSLTGWPSPEPC